MAGIAVPRAAARSHGRDHARDRRVRRDGARRRTSTSREGTNMIPTDQHRAWRQYAPIAVAVMASWQFGCSEPAAPLPLDSSALALEQPIPAPGRSALRI